MRAPRSPIEVLVYLIVFVAALVVLLKLIALLG